MQASWSNGSSNKEVQSSSSNSLLHGGDGQGGSGEVGSGCSTSNIDCSGSSSRKKEDGVEGGGEAAAAAAGHGGGVVSGGHRVGGARRRRKLGDGHRSKGVPRGLFPIPEVNQASPGEAALLQQQQQDEEVDASTLEGSDGDGHPQHQQQQEQPQEGAVEGIMQLQARGPRSSPGGRERVERPERSSSQDGPKLQQLLEQDQQLLHGGNSRPPCVGYELSMPTVVSPDIVCGRTAEAEALSRQEEQAAEQQQQQQRGLLGGKRDERGVLGEGVAGLAGVGRGSGTWSKAAEALSPGISREHSTTEVVSREASFASSEDGSPRASGTNASEDTLILSTPPPAAVDVAGTGGGRGVTGDAVRAPVAGVQSSAWEAAAEVAKQTGGGSRDIASSFAAGCPGVAPGGSSSSSSMQDGGRHQGGAMDGQKAHWGAQHQEQQQQQQSQQEEPITEALQAQMCFETEQHSLMREEQQQGQRLQQQSEQEQLRDAEAAAPAVRLSAASSTAAQAVHACASVPGDHPSITSSDIGTIRQAPKGPQQHLHTGSRVSAETMETLPSEGSNRAQGESSGSTLLPSSSSSISMKHDPRSSSSRRPHSAPESTSLPAVSGGTSSIPGSSSSGSSGASTSRNTGRQDSKPVAGEGPSLQRKSGGRTSPSGPFLKPLFVPIVVCMDEADHTMIAEEALGHQLASSSSSRGPLGGASASAAGPQASGGGPLPELSLGAFSGPNNSNTAVKHGAAGGGGCGGATVGGVIDTEQVREAIRKARVLQDYLCVYEGQGLPVVRVSYGNFGEALDKLHEYILQCIKVAMQL